MRQSWESLLWLPGQEPIADGGPLANNASIGDISPVSATGAALVVPANYLMPGKVLRLTASGRYGTTATPTLVLGFYYGGIAGVALAATAAITMPSTVTTQVWRMQAEVVIRSIGTSGTAMTVGELHYASTTTAMSLAPLPSSAPATVGIDTTVGKALAVGATWGTANAANTITCHNFVAEELN